MKAICWNGGRSQDRDVRSGIEEPGDVIVKAHVFDLRLGLTTSMGSCPP